MSSSTTHLAPAFLPLAGLALALTAFSAPAQTVIPPSAANALGGAGAGFPFSYTGYVRYQQALDKSYLTPGLLYGVSFRSRSTTLSIPERQWQEMRVILADLTAATPAATTPSARGTPSVASRPGTAPPGSGCTPPTRTSSAATPT